MHSISAWFSRALLTALCSTVWMIAVPEVRGEVRWSENIEQSLKSANAQQRLVLMKFTASWCGPCRQMEKVTFGNPEVSTFINQTFVPVLVDGDKHRDLARHLQVKGFPTLLVVSPEMVIVHREQGFRTAKQLLPILKTLSVQHKSTLASQRSQSVTAARPPQGIPPQTMPPQTMPTQAMPQTAAVPVSQTRPTAASQAQPAVTPAFGGLCLTGVFETRSLVRGRPEFGLRYRGKVLYFSDAAHRDQFRATPEKFWPTGDGACPVTLAEEGRVVEGKLEYAAMFKNQLWLTSSREKMDRFVLKPASFIEQISK